MIGITVTPTSRNAANTAGSQALVANGVAFNATGDLYIADSARGARLLVISRRMQGLSRTPR